MKRRSCRDKKPWSLAKEVAVTAVMATLLVLGKLALSFIPNVEVVTSLTMVFTLAFGFRRTVFAVLVFCLFDPLIYPSTPDVLVQYFFHWPLLCVVTALVGRNCRPPLLWGVLPALAALMAVAFWLETPTVYVLMGIARPEQWKIYAIAGFPFFIPSLCSGIGGVIVLAPALGPLLGRICMQMFGEPSSLLQTSGKKKPLPAPEKEAGEEACSLGSGGKRSSPEGDGAGNVLKEEQPEQTEETASRGLAQGERAFPEGDGADNFSEEEQPEREKGTSSRNPKGEGSASERSFGPEGLGR